MRVETGGRFIQEKEETRLSGKLDTNSRTLAVFDAEGTDNSISVSLETTHLQTLVDTETRIRLRVNFLNI